MKIKVSYTKIVEEVIEVIEKFCKLTSPVGRDALYSKEQHALASELLTEIVNRIDVCYPDILEIKKAGMDEIVH